jgi:GAF domain-containing protein
MRRCAGPEKAQAKRPAAKKAPKRGGHKVHYSEKRLVEALEQQAATSEILRVISKSPTDTQPVFDIIADRAGKLCEAQLAVVSRFDGKMIDLAAIHGLVPEAVSMVRNMFPMRLDARSMTASVIRSGTVAHLADVLAEESYGLKEFARVAGYRGAVAVPLLREGNPIGCIAVMRPETGLFPDSQIRLLQTLADQAVIAIENVRLFNETKEALDQQTATAQILEAISSSPGNLDPVLNTLVHAAAKFCAAPDVVITRVDDSALRVAAAVGTFADVLLREAGSIRAVEVPLTRGSVSGRAFLERRTVNIHDLATESEEEYPEGRTLQRRFGHRSIVAAPLLREGEAIGVISLHRMEVKPFSDKQLQLLRLFADQAVIAIENVRLFNETKEALERQTATSEVLEAISGAQADASPVFETIARNAHRLSGAVVCNVLRYDGSLLDIAASYGFSPEDDQQQRRKYPVKPGDASVLSGRVILSGKVEQIDDAVRDPLYDQKHAAAHGARRILGVPMLRDGAVLGVIVVAWHEPGQTPVALIDLLKTFADQAVIAIENVRLFNETKEALERQTATSEILRVISQSPRDVQPVFQTIVDAALKLCHASSGTLLTYDGKLCHVGAIANLDREAGDAIRRIFPRPAGPDTTVSRAVLTRSVVEIPDVLEDADYDKVIARAGGYRATLAVPLMRAGNAIGGITVHRPEPGRFSNKQIALLQTFADQAVIAIENVRLFTELEARTVDLTRSVGELKALGEVGQAVTSTLDLETVLSTIVSRATQLAGVDGGSIYEYDSEREEFHVRATDRLPEDLVEVAQTAPIRRGEGLLGRMAISGEPVEIPDIADAAAYQSRVREHLIRLGYRSLLAVPLLRENQIIGGLAVYRKRAGTFDSQVIELLKTFATQSALAIQNARLFREIEVKSRELEAASQHKSEFLANMSHELRTPLNAIIGFSEVLSERMFGEINEKQAEYIADILQSGQHLLSLINDILDLSKIEAGRMELELSEFDLPATIESTLTLVRERAVRRGVALGQAVDERLGKIRADERKVKQVLLNLLSNALKFTPEGGRIDVRAAATDGVAELSVTDTGVGIAPEEQEAVFEEFRQVGTASKKVEGTGLGLAISRKFIELHGGRIWVNSVVGSGSTFAFTLPLR